MNTCLRSGLPSTAEDLLQLLESWVEKNWLREIDLALARFFWNEAPDADPLLLLGTALASHQLGRGHVCIDLQQLLDDPYMTLSLPPENNSNLPWETLTTPSEILSDITWQHWCRKLRHPSLVSEGAGNTPLVFSGGRLYLRRYWQYERSLEAEIGRRLAQTETIERSLPSEELKQLLSLLFPQSVECNDGPEKTNWQKIACALAARNAFSMITGGPGTGKTTTVVRLLALLQSLTLKTNGNSHPLRISLAAPTGKAAARLRESISSAIHQLPSDLFGQQELRDAIPSKVITLHRLLGSRPDSRMFRHNARNPLALDVLIVDEASMVDLEMMAAVMSALPDHARLVLLGDKDQLASVEAGSMLGELCRHAHAGHYTKATLSWLHNVTGEKIDTHLSDPEGTPLNQSTVMLRHSHRFSSASGIGRLAEAVNSGDPKQIEHVWDRGYPDLQKHDLKTLLDPTLDALILGCAKPDSSTARQQGYAHYLQVMSTSHPAMDANLSEFDEWARRVIRAYGRFQILCALRNGPYGVFGLNQRIQESLARNGLINLSSNWYQGRPVLVTRNNYQLGLMNGDIGITLRYPQRDKNSGEIRWVTRVAFPKSEGTNGTHWVLPGRLSSVETVYAMTVHKSQGSEFDHAVLLLPPRVGPVITRELVYTGITRAKKWFTFVSTGNPRIMGEAATCTVQRSGGLFL